MAYKYERDLEQQREQLIEKLEAHANEHNSSNVKKISETLGKSGDIVDRCLRTAAMLVDEQEQKIQMMEAHANESNNLKGKCCGISFTKSYVLKLFLALQ